MTTSMEPTPLLFGSSPKNKLSLMGSIDGMEMMLAPSTGVIALVINLMELSLVSIDGMGMMLTLTMGVITLAINMM